MRDPADRPVLVRAGDLEALIDRVVYAPTWTPDTLGDLDGCLLGAVARGVAALDADQ